MLCILFLGNKVAYASGSDIKIIIDGTTLSFSAGEAKPMEQNDRILVPMRKIFEALTCYVHYDKGFENWEGLSESEADQYIIVWHQYDKLPIYFRLVMGKKKAYIGEKLVDLDVAPTIINGSAYVPLRFVAESAYTTVDWRAEDRTVLINKKGIMTPEEYGQANPFLPITIGNNVIESNDSWGMVYDQGSVFMGMVINSEEDVDCILANLDDKQIQQYFASVAVKFSDYYYGTPSTIGISAYYDGVCFPVVQFLYFPQRQKIFMKTFIKPEGA